MTRTLSATLWRRRASSRYPVDFSISPTLGETGWSSSVTRPVQGTRRPRSARTGVHPIVQGRKGQSKSLRTRDWHGRDVLARAPGAEWCADVSFKRAPTSLPGCVLTLSGSAPFRSFPRKREVSSGPALPFIVRQLRRSLSRSLVSWTHRPFDQRAQDMRGRYMHLPDDRRVIRWRLEHEVAQLAHRSAGPAGEPRS